MSHSTTTATLREFAIVPAKERKRNPAQSAQVFFLPGLRIQFVEGSRVLLLSGRAISTAARASTRRELIDRLFSIPALESLRLNWRKGEARLEFASAPGSRAEILGALGLAMGERSVDPLHFPLGQTVVRDDLSPILEIRRAGSGLTLWRIDAFSTRVFHLSHPLLRVPSVRKEVLEELATLTDSVHRSFYFPFSGGDSILVFIRPHRIDHAVFPEVLDPVLTRCVTAGRARETRDVRDVVLNANLAVAPIADFLFPPLGLVNIAFTGFLSRKYLPNALAPLREGKFTLEFLYLVIAVLTVVTYEFFPAALMYWLMHFWPRRSRQLYESRHSMFLARYRHRPRRVWVERGGISVETKVEELSPSSVVTLKEGDIVPGDGTIVEGSAQIGERLITGVTASVSRNAGGAIYAASRVVSGSVRMKITGLGENTAAARLARWYRDSLERQHSESRSVAVAERSVLPVLLAGAAAVLPGGLAAVKSAIRPDYVTGPAISEDLVGLATVIRAANAGILISRKSALKKLLRSSCVVFDDSVAWNTPDMEGGTFAEAARSQGLPEVVFFSGGSRSEAARHAERLGIQYFHPAGSSVEKLNYIALRQRSGDSVVYVGDCDRESAVAAQANLAVSVIEPPYHRLSGAPVTLLSPSLERFLLLREIAIDSQREFNTAFGLALAPNLAATFAALFLASPIYVSVLLTSLGTMANYLRSAAILQITELE